jgi:hypothetical protein
MMAPRRNRTNEFDPLLMDSMQGVEKASNLHIAPLPLIMCVPPSLRSLRGYAKRCRSRMATGAAPASGVPQCRGTDKLR